MARTAWRVVPVALLCAAGMAEAAQRTQPAKDEARVIRGAQVGRPMRAVSLDVDLRDLPIVPDWQPGDPIKDIPRRRYPTAEYTADPARRIPDPLLARQLEPLPNTRDFDVPILNFDAQNYTGVNPPDTVGDVGPGHYVQAINNSSSSSVVVYDKVTGGVMAGPFLMSSLGAPPPCAGGRGDPIVLYDVLADRWLLAEFTSTGNGVCIYISKTPDPVMGGWWNYVLSTPNFPDYMKFAVWPDAYYMGANEGNAPPAYALDRANMLNGATARPAQRFTAPGLPAFGFELITPADVDGTAPPPGAPAIFGRHRDDESHNPPGTPGGDPLELWAFHVDFTTPANSTFTQLPNVVVSEFSSEMCGLSSFSCIPQPGSTIRLDPLTEMVMFRFVYRDFGTHQTLLGQLTVDADGEPDNPANLERTGQRWFELRNTGGGWTLFQEGTHSPDPTPRWMAGIAMDGDGNIALGYNASNDNPAVFPSLRYAGRLATDAPGTMRAEVLLAAGAAFNNSVRYGDYSAMSVDPADDCTFWFTGMYNPVNNPVNRWRTRVASFKFDSCGNAVPANNAVFDTGLQAPACLPTGRSCDSAGLLTGRDTITGGPEPNQPNTIADSCADGTVGRFHVRESIDRIKVQTIDATQMSPGKTVRVDVTVWGFSRGFADALDIYYTATAAAPAWTHLGTVRSGKVGPHTVSMTYTLPAGAVQAVRARYRYRGESTPCGVGDVTDHDDLVFAVQ